MDAIIKIIKLYAICSLTMMPIVIIVFINAGFAGGIAMVFTCFILVPLNTVICTLIYYLKINRAILEKYWIASIESSFYILCLIVLLNTNIPFLQKYENYEFYIKIGLPYAIIIPVLFIQQLIVNKMNKLRSSRGNT